MCVDRSPMQGMCVRQLASAAHDRLGHVQVPECIVDYDMQGAK